MVSIIIGGTRGIGKVIKEHLTARGDLVYTVSRSDLKQKSHISCDIAKCKKSVFDRIDRIDNIIFTHRYRGDDWDEAFNVTVKAVNNVVDAAVHKFDKGGSVVIISSNASQFILEEQPPEYHASRAALEALMRYYVVAYGNKSIRFNCVLPSTLIKPENKNFFTKDNNVRNMIEKITPLNRMGTADDIANIVDFLCSQKSSFLTGNSFMADGGLSLIGQETIARNLLDCNHEK
mgnify:FL=1